jgi:hypothetical protein
VKRVKRENFEQIFLNRGREQSFEPYLNHDMRNEQPFLNQGRCSHTSNKKPATKSEPRNQNYTSAKKPSTISETRNQQQ